MAVKRLISDATVFPASRFPNPSDNLVRQFEKHGDYKKAVEDFYAIRPEDLRDFTMPSGVCILVSKHSDTLPQGYITFLCSHHEKKPI